MNATPNIRVHDRNAGPYPRVAPIETSRVGSAPVSLWHATGTTRAIRQASIVVLPSFELGSYRVDEKQGRRNPIRWRR
jgi:hypothetical protein